MKKITFQFSILLFASMTLWSCKKEALITPVATDYTEIDYIFHAPDSATVKTYYKTYINDVETHSGEWSFGQFSGLKDTFKHGDHVKVVLSNNTYIKNITIKEGVHVMYDETSSASDFIIIALL